VSRRPRCAGWRKAVRRLFRQINFAADFQQIRNFALEPQRNRPDGADVLRDIIAGRAVAARGGQLEHAFAVGQRERDAVDFRFDGPAQLDAGQETFDARHELIRFLQRIRVVQTLHGHAVAHLSETFERPAGHALGGGVGRAQFRMRIFQIAQFAQERVVFAVRDLGRGLVVVKLVVVRDLAPEFTDAGRDVRGGHGW
jgi:hypothetical protein